MLSVNSQRAARTAAGRLTVAQEAVLSLLAADWRVRDVCGGIITRATPPEDAPMRPSPREYGSATMRALRQLGLVTYTLDGHQRVWHLTTAGRRWYDERVHASASATRG